MTDQPTIATTELDRLRGELRALRMFATDPVEKADYEAAMDSDDPKALRGVIRRLRAKEAY